MDLVSLVLLNIQVLTKSFCSYVNSPLRKKPANNTSEVTLKFRFLIANSNTRDVIIVSITSNNSIAFALSASML